MSFSIAGFWHDRYYENMAATRQEALEIASKVRSKLEKLYGQRLRGVYLYGSAARDQFTPDSDIDIAIVLDNIKSHYEEIEYTGQLGSDVSLEYNTLVTFLFVSEEDYNKGRFAVHGIIKKEGIAA
jgi:predicted nucleotidyltransferase